MRIVSILENQNIEKRIAITPEIAKKYIALGFEISIVEKYGEHLGFKDSDYKDLGVEISNNESEILNQVEKMLLDGATFIDVGAYSSRPGAQHISEEEELKRSLPVISLLLQYFPFEHPTLLHEHVSVIFSDLGHSSRSIDI